MSDDERLAVSLGERSYDIVVGTASGARRVGAGAGAAPAGRDHRHRRQSGRHPASRCPGAQSGEQVLVVPEVRLAAFLDEVGEELVPPAREFLRRAGLHTQGEPE